MVVPSAPHIVMPLLRERREDIPALVDLFLARERERGHTSVVHILPAAMRVLEAHAWPGNLRELENLVRRLSLLAPHPDVGVDDLLDVAPTLRDGARRRHRGRRPAAAKGGGRRAHRSRSPALRRQQVPRGGPARRGCEHLAPAPAGPRRPLTSHRHPADRPLTNRQGALRSTSLPRRSRVPTALRPRPRIP